MSPQDFVLEEVIVPWKPYQPVMRPDTWSGGLNIKWHSHPTFSIFRKEQHRNALRILNYEVLSFELRSSNLEVTTLKLVIPW